jgi:hypothetical protein
MTVLSVHNDMDLHPETWAIVPAGHGPVNGLWVVTSEGSDAPALVLAAVRTMEERQQGKDHGQVRKGVNLLIDAAWLSAQAGTDVGELLERLRVEGPQVRISIVPIGSDGGGQ